MFRGLGDLLGAGGMCSKERCKIGILSSSGSTQRVQLGFSSQLETLKGAGPSLLLRAAGMKGRQVVSGSPGAVRVCR